MEQVSAVLRALRRPIRDHGSLESCRVLAWRLSDTVDVERVTLKLEDLLGSFVEAEAGRAAGAILLAEGSSRVAFSADDQLPGASVLKLPLVMALFDEAARGHVDMRAPVKCSSLDETVYASVLQAFEADDSLTISQLAGLALMTSDNPSASWLLRLVGADVVNSWLRANGCSDTRIVASFSDSDLSVLGRQSVTTVGDCLTVLRLLDLEPRFARVRTWLENNVRNSRIPARLPDDLAIAHKTGSLDGVINDVGIIPCPMGSIAVAFLTVDQQDPIVTSVDIADACLGVWRCLGGD